MSMNFIELMNNIIYNSENLGNEFEKVLFDNLEHMYQYDKKKENIMSLKSFAEQEFAILEKLNDPENQYLVLEFKDEIIKLVEKFGDSGQSGGSAPYVASTIVNCIKDLLMYKSLTPVMNIDDEWVEVSENLMQNKRCSALFKTINTGKCHYLDAVIFREYYNDGSSACFTGHIGNMLRSSMIVKQFPFEPISFYIDVEKTDEDNYKIKNPEEMKKVYEIYEDMN